MNIIKGDLLKLAENGEFDVIVHGCNCFNTMGGGLAWQIAQKYPEVVRVDQDTIRGDVAKLGTYTQATVVKNENSFVVINAYTQYGCNARDKKDLFEYTAFAEILVKLKEEFPDKRFGFPKIGCGLAGGNEYVILNMINDFSKLVNDYVTIVEYE